MSDKPRCAKTLRKGGPWQFFDAQCERAGTVREGGKLWCKQHAPSNVEKRRAKCRKESDARWNEYQRKNKMDIIKTSIAHEVLTNGVSNIDHLESLRAQYRALEKEQ